MKIGLQTWGTDGDFMPFLALAIGLRDAGHSVTLAYTSVDGKDYENRADVAGIKLIKADDGIKPNTAFNPYNLASKPGSFTEYSKLLDIYFEPYTEAMYQVSEKLCTENDVVIGHAASVTLQIASEKYSCPRVSLVLTPLIVKSKFVSPIQKDLGPLLNVMLWKIGGAVSTKLWFKKAQQIRKREGLPPVRSLQNQVFTSDLLTIVASSPSITSHQPDWKPTTVTTGFLNLPEQHSSWQMPDELKSFLDAGEPPIYMTFGSCLQFDLEASTLLMLEAAKLSGKRTIIQSDWSKLTLEIPENVYPIDRVPHAQLFPHCSLVVHHGGAGTTQSTLLAGKPSVVIPHGFDQPYWADLLHTNGVAATPISRKLLTSHNLAGEMKWVDAAEHLKKKASDIGASMESENGVSNCIQLLNELI